MIDLLDASSATTVLLGAILAPSGAAQSVQLQPPLILPFVAPDAPLAAALADVDGDVQLDLALLDRSPASLRVIRNQGGAFSTGPVVNLPFGVDRGDVAAADLDEDGDVDLVACSAQAGVAQVVENTGSGLLLSGSPLAVGTRPLSLAIGDLDGDGDFDVAVGNEQSAFVSLLRNQGGLVFGVESLATSASASAVVVTDLDRDGDHDLAALDATARELHVWLQVGGQLVAQAPLALASSNVALVDLEAGDLDGDGDEDLIATGYTLQGFNILVAQAAYAVGNGSLQSGPLMLLKSGGGGLATLGDLDADGLPDLAISNVLGFHVAVHVNPGSGGFNGTLPTIVPLAFGAGDLVAGDVDGNGVGDLVLCDPVAAEVRLYLNTKAGTPCALQAYCTAKPSSLGTLPSIGASGVPSFGAQGFALRLSAAVPGSVAIGIRGLGGPSSLPFQGGTLCVQPPIGRLGPCKLSAAGNTSLPLAIPTALIGVTAWHQWWFRDPAQPDGTGVGLSDGLVVTYCP